MENHLDTYTLHVHTNLAAPASSDVLWMPPEEDLAGTMGFYIRWLLISLFAHMEEFRHFDLLNAFGYIERVVKPDFFLSQKTFFTVCVLNIFELSSYISTMNGAVSVPLP